MNFVWVGIGGALGSILRYCISLIPHCGLLPFTTLAANLIGAILIGLFVGFADGFNWNSNTILFLKTGFCGGFTTFSTFSLEACTLFQNHHSLLAILYILSSVTLCIVGIWLGFMLSKLFSAN